VLWFLSADTWRDEEPMVLTKDELIASLQKEVRILLHLATKIDPEHIEYRPTPKQRSTLELLHYLSYMGPMMLKAVGSGGFDREAWGAEVQTAQSRDFAQTVDAIAATADEYSRVLGQMSDADFRREIEMFGRRSTIGYFLVNTVLAGYAAYRTQLFLYLKSCGRTELNTMNLWAGMDPPAA
jgi:hypothetical protein